MLTKCINSLYENSKSDYHLYIIDNASTDNTIGLYAHKLPKTTLIRNNDNKWWGGGINQGLAISLQDDAEYVAFLNDDIEVSEGWDLKLIDILKRREVGAVGPINSNTRDWQGYDNVRARLVKELPEHKDIDKNDVKAMSYELNKFCAEKGYYSLDVRGMLAFFCVMFRKSTNVEIGYFDSKFDYCMCGDDDDYARRLEKVGYGLTLALNCYVLHHGGQSINKIESNKRKEQQLLAKSILKLKYPERYGKFNEKDGLLIDKYNIKV